MTSFQGQAERWAKRKAMRKGGAPIVNVYDLSENLSEFDVLSFQGDNETWLDFICSCRKGQNVYRAYDLVIGSVANDDVFRTVDMYFRGIWDKVRTIQELRFYKMNDQDHLPGYGCCYWLRYTVWSGSATLSLRWQPDYP